MLRCQFLCYILKTLFSIKIALKLSYFYKKLQNFRALGLRRPDPRASGGWGLCPQTPKLTPHCEFLATCLRCSKVARGSWALNQLKHFVDEQTLRSAYHCLIYILANNTKQSKEFFAVQLPTLNPIKHK